jgi:acyl carrier protein
MTRQEITAVVLEVLGDVAPDADLASLGATEPMQEALELDSFDFLTFLQGLDEALGVEIPERDYPQLTTIEACVDYVAGRLPAPA